MNEPHKIKNSDAHRGTDLLIVRADRSDPLVIAPQRLATEIARAAERVKEILEWT
jgi:hypothetical protein